MISPFVGLLIPALQLAGLALIVILLHRVSPHIGLAPLFLFMGGLTATLQFRGLGTFEISGSVFAINFSQASFTILPVLLLGLLLIYVANGTTTARFTLVGMVLLTLLISTLRSFPRLDLLELAGMQIHLRYPEGHTPWALLVSAFAFALDLLALVVIYQWISNQRGQHPSRLGAALALLAAVWVDALVYPLLSDWNSPGWGASIAIHLLGKSAAAGLLIPLLVSYVMQVIPRISESSTRQPRPVMDILTTSHQWEARARYHYSLLQTLSEVNKLIVRTLQPQTLLTKACQLLVSTREYPLAWISLVEPGAAVNELSITACEAEKPEYASFCATCLDNSSPGNNPIQAVLLHGQAVILHDLSAITAKPGWHAQARANGFQALAVFPIRLADQTRGILSVCSRQNKAFKNEEEINLLQELADDLAYALDNLKTRSKQVMLETAAESMRDGLMILDLSGKIIYANPTFARMIQRELKSLLASHVMDLMYAEDSRQFIAQKMRELRENGRMATEVDLIDAQGGHVILALRASLVTDSQSGDAYYVCSAVDITQRMMYEQQLLTLNQLTAELVQIFEPVKLLNSVLFAAEKLLQVDCSAVYLFVPDSLAIANIHAHQLPEEYLDAIRSRPDGSIEMAAALTAQPVWISHLDEDVIYREQMPYASATGIQAALMFPVQYQGKILGVLGLYERRPHYFTQEEQQLGLTVCQTLAIALLNAHLYQQEHSQRELAEALSQASGVLNSTLDLDKVLDHILEQTRRVVPCRSVNLMLVEGEVARVVRNLDHREEDKISGSPVGFCLPLASPTLQSMLESKQPMLVEDTHTSPMWDQRSHYSWIRSYAAAPLMVRQEVIGFLNINSDQPDFFDHETLQRLQAFAATAAAAIHNARLYSDLQQHSLELESRVSKRTAELQMAKERIETIVTSVPDAVFVLDDTNKLMEANQAGQALLAQAETNGNGLFEEAFLSQLRDSSARPNEKAIREVKGRAYQALASPLPLDEDREGLVVVFRDVTRFRELDRMKTQFVTDVSHELRTPLTNLSIYLDLITNTQDDQKRKIYLNTLRRETDRLTHLIEDLLTISRVEGDRLHVDIRPVDIGQLVKDLVNDRKPMANAQGLELSCTQEPDPICGLADVRLLTQVLSNLLTNALSYTRSPGTIQIHSQVTDSPDGPWLTIAIRDTGVGIEPDELPHVFERFYRGSASRSTGAAGTGLGLAISDELAGLMGGRLSVTSEVGKGSTFTVWLPPML